MPTRNEGLMPVRLMNQYRDMLEALNIDYMFAVCDASDDDNVSILDLYFDPVHGCRKGLLRYFKYDPGYMLKARDAINMFNTDYVFFTDADGQYDPSEFPKFWALRDEHDMVVGVKTKRCDPLWRRIGPRIYHRLLNYLFFGTAHYEPDMNCGFRLMNREIIENVVSELKYLHTAPGDEITIRAVLHGYKIGHIPIQHYPRTYGGSRLLKITRNWLPDIPNVLRLWFELRCHELWLGAVGNRLRRIYRRITGKPDIDHVFSNVYVGSWGKKRWSTYDPIVDCRKIPEGSVPLRGNLTLQIDTLNNYATKHKRNILFLCDKGRGRAPMVAVCHLMRHYGFDLQEATGLIKLSRPHVWWTKRQLQFMEQYEQWLKLSA